MRHPPQLVTLLALRVLGFEHPQHLLKRPPVYAQRLRALQRHHSVLAEHLLPRIEKAVLVHDRDLRRSATLGRPHGPDPDDWRLPRRASALLAVHPKALLL